MEIIYEVSYLPTGIEDSVYKAIVDLEEVMGKELVRVYNIFATYINKHGLTRKINNEFKELHPNYFKENKGKKWFELNEWNKWTAQKYQEIVNELDLNSLSEILDFYYEEDVYLELVGVLKQDKNVKIGFTIHKV